MKFKELARMSKIDREKKLQELELELIKMNAQVATGTPPKNAGQLKRIKKDIAKINFLNSIESKKPAPQLSSAQVTSQSTPKSTPQKKEAVGTKDKQKSEEKTNEKTK